MEMNSTMLPVPSIVMENSQSSKLDDPTRKRVSNLTMKLKNAFRISSSVSTPSPSNNNNNNDNNNDNNTNTNNEMDLTGGLPLKTRSHSLPTNIHSNNMEATYQQQYYTLPPPPPLPLNELSNDPFHFQRQTTIPILYDDNNNKEINDHQYYGSSQQHSIMDIDHQQLLINNETTILITDDDESKCIPSLIESTCSSTVSEDSNILSSTVNHHHHLHHQQQQNDDDHFEFEQHTQWIDTSKHWYSDIIPFYNKSSNNNNNINNNSNNNNNNNNNENNNNVLSTTSPNSSLQRSSSIASLSPTNEGILKTANKSILGKRPISSSSTISTQDNNDISSTSPTSSSSSSSSSSDNGNSGYNLIKGSLHKKKKKRVPAIRFDKMVQVHSTYSQNDYNRQSDPEAICTRLNAQLAFQIKQELNIYKNTEMPVHENSRIYTHFFY
ncbi:unnamed protein product [Cunninghamella blakesleeana]